jgi:hypothetical protein
MSAANKRIANAVKVAFEDMGASGVIWLTPTKEAIEAMTAEISALPNARDLHSFEIAMFVYKKANMPALIESCLGASIEAVRGLK